MKLYALVFVFVQLTNADIKLHNEKQVLSDVHDIFKLLNHGQMRYQAYDWLEDLTSKFGHRMVGSEALESSIDHVLQNIRKQGFANARKVPVPNLVNWVRGEAEAWLLEPERHPIPILATGRSVSGNVQAEAIVVQSFDELHEIGKTGNLFQKIVVYNHNWTTYGASAPYRSRGAKEAAKYGAVAVLIRSASSGHFSVHTGNNNYDSRITHIPSACVSAAVAEALARIYNKGEKLVMSVRLGSHQNGTVGSHNTIFELTGSEHPEQVIQLSGHLDSWDVGTGAMDDGGGCATMWAALTAIHKLGLKPRRTIQVVFWTSEETGMFGARHLFNAGRRQFNKNLIFALESDHGAFKPTEDGATLEIAGTDAQKAVLKSITKHLKVEGVHFGLKTINASHLTDITFYAQDGVPSVEYTNTKKIDYYFQFHHTEQDTIAVFERDEFDLLAASFASIAYMLSEAETLWEI